MEFPALFKSAAARVLSSELRAVNQALGIAQEATLRDLQAQIRNQGWTMLRGGDAKTSFTRSELGAIVDVCRAAALKNPLIIRGLAVRREYVFGQGVSIEADGEADNAALAEFLTDRRNRRQLTGHDGFGYAQTELDATGNLFTACIAEDRAGRALRVPQVRTIPFEQMTATVCNPEDSEEVWYYKRSRIMRPFDPTAADGWGAAVEVVEWHPSLSLWRETRSNRASRVPAIGGKPVRWDAPLAHRRRGGWNHWAYGLPIVYPAIDWATAHTRYLSNWDSFVSALAQVAVTLTKAGATQDQITAMKAQLDSTFVGGGSSETNPAPIAGSTAILSDRVKMDAFKASGMAPEIGDAKGFRLQIAAALGVPDHLLSGDADQGSLATARTLDRPTELAIASEQKAWAEYLGEIGQWAIEARRRSIAETRVEVRVGFPPILEHDPEQTVKAIAQAVSAPISPDLAGAEYEIRKALLQSAGVPNADEILAAADFAEPANAPGGGPGDKLAGEAVASRFAQRIIHEIARRKAAA